MHEKFNTEQEETGKGESTNEQLGLAKATPVRPRADFLPGESGDTWAACGYRQYEVVLTSALSPWICCRDLSKNRFASHVSDVLTRTTNLQVL